MDLDTFFNENPMGGFETYGSSDDFRSGFVTLVGRPNSGKSTLLNALMGKKIAITSKTSQTTRHRISAVLSEDDFQMIIVDTPGIHKPHDALGEQLNDSAIKALDDVDVVAMLIDASKDIGSGDEWVATQVRNCRSKKICVLTKSDLVDDDQIAKQVKRLESLAAWDSVITLSSKTGYNLKAFEEECFRLLPKGPAWFPRDMDTDQPMEVMVAEFIREKIFRTFRDEVPHSVGVQVDDMQYVGKKKLYRIFASIYVERDSQKAMIIGHNGDAIKKTGMQSRKDLEELLGCKVFLDLSVKVKKNWRKDDKFLKRFGYMEQ